MKASWKTGFVAPCLLLPLLSFGQSDRSKLPPSEDFYKRPAYSQVSLSPDGHLMAALVPYNGRTNLALVDLEKKTATVLTEQSSDDVLRYQWLGNRVIEVMTADLDSTGGVSYFNLHPLIDVVDKKLLRDLTTVARFGVATVIETIDEDGYEMVIQTHDRNDSNDRDSGSADAYYYNARTGQKRLLTFETPGFVFEFLCDHHGQVRIAESSPHGSQRTIVSYRRSNDDKWKTLRDEPAGSETFEPLAFDYDDRTLYVRVRSEESGGRGDVYAFDTETGQLGARVFAETQSDAGFPILDRVQKKLVGVSATSADRTHWVDPQWQQTQKAVDEALPQAHNRLAWARDNTDRVLIASQTDGSAPSYFLLNRKAMTMERVAQSRPWLKDADMSPRVFVRYRARDGLSIPGYLTMPQRPDGAKPPLIVVIHGGPFVPAERFGYDQDAQFFASRGYAVLQPDFRGTVGYGTAFEQAGWKQWGLAMQDDVTDGVRWLIDTGKVDGDRVCLYGASYGGYATLWGLEKEPKMFRCGVAFLAVSNLELMFDVNWSDFMSRERNGESTKSLTLRLGDPATDREKLRAVSPVNHADRLEAPLLLAYGATDRRVPIIHGNEMRSALDNAHKEYEWVVYSEQQHTYFGPENRADFYKRVEAFLAKNLAPRTTTAAAPPDAPPSMPPSPVASTLQ